MPKALTYLRLPLLALLASCALTSCFGDKKKDDPKPAICPMLPPPPAGTN
jgi:hypothetical protein